MKEPWRFKNTASFDFMVFNLEKMLRREIRERREYIYRKHKEESESKIRDRKEKLKRALDENKPIPTELKVKYL